MTREFGRITPDGIWWVKLRRRGWVQVEDLLDEMDRARRDVRRGVIATACLLVGFVVGSLVAAL